MIKIIRFFFNFYILLNIHVALSVAALYWVFHPHYSTEYIIFLISGTILSYTIVRLFSFGSNRFFVKRFLAQHKVITAIFMAFVALLNLISYLQLDFWTQLGLLPFFLITFWYNYDSKWLPFGNIRNYGIIKIMIVALVWTGMVILVPAIKHPINQTLLLGQSIFVFFFVLMLTLSFDQRDLLIDTSELNTIPRLFGKQLLTIYGILIGILSLTAYYIFPQTQFIISELIILVSAYFCYQSNEYKSFYYTAFWIEALPILWFFILLLIQKSHLQ